MMPVGLKTGDFLVTVTQPSLETCWVMVRPCSSCATHFSLLGAAVQQCPPRDKEVLLCSTAVLHLSFGSVWGGGPLTAIKQGGL